MLQVNASSYVNQDTSVKIFMVQTMSVGQGVYWYLPLLSKVVSLTHDKISILELLIQSLVHTHTSTVAATPGYQNDW